MLASNFAYIVRGRSGLLNVWDISYFFDVRHLNRYNPNFQCRRSNWNFNFVKNVVHAMNKLMFFVSRIDHYRSWTTIVPRFLCCLNMTSIENVTLAHSHICERCSARRIFNKLLKLVAQI